MKDDNEKKSVYSVGMFNVSNSSERDGLNYLLTRTQRPKNTDTDKLVEWLKNYVNSPNYLKLYNEHTLQATAEATFLAVELGLDTHLEKMNYAEIRNFKPVEESIYQTTERAKLIKELLKKLTITTNHMQDSAVLGQAAWCVYIHKNTYEKVKEEQYVYESEQKNKNNCKI